MVVCFCWGIIAYAVLRYQVFGLIAWKELPLFILNKAVALTSLVLVVISSLLQVTRSTELFLRKGWVLPFGFVLKSAFFFVMLHVLMGLLLFGSVHYKKFFAIDGGLNLYAGMSMLGGILSYTLFNSCYRRSEQTVSQEEEPLLDKRELFKLLFLLLAFHLFYMGFEGWFTPHTWYGGLPPISLIGFLVLLLGYLTFMFSSKRD